MLVVLRFALDHSANVSFDLNHLHCAQTVDKPNEDGLGLGHVFDEINKVYGEDFLRYKPLDNEEDK